MEKDFGNEQFNFKTRKMKKKCLQCQQAKCFLINEKCFIHIKTKRKVSDFLKLLKTG